MTGQFQSHAYSSHGFRSAGGVQSPLAWAASMKLARAVRHLMLVEAMQEVRLSLDALRRQTTPPLHAVVVGDFVDRQPDRHADHHELPAEGALEISRFVLGFEGFNVEPTRHLKHAAWREGDGIEHVVDLVVGRQHALVVLRIERAHREHGHEAGDLLAPQLRILERRHLDRTQQRRHQHWPALEDAQFRVGDVADLVAVEVEKALADGRLEGVFSPELVSHRLRAGGRDARRSFQTGAVVARPVERAVVRPVDLPLERHLQNLALGCIESVAHADEELSIQDVTVVSVGTQQAAEVPLAGVVEPGTAGLPEVVQLGESRHGNRAGADVEPARRMDDTTDQRLGIGKMMR